MTFSPSPNDIGIMMIVFENINIIIKFYIREELNPKLPPPRVWLYSYLISSLNTYLPITKKLTPKKFLIS